MARPVLITRESRAREAAELFKRAQFDGRTWTYGDDRRVMYEKLVEANGDPDKVSAILSSGWCTHSCSACGEESSVTVQVGDEPDYESSTAWLCPPCLRAAVALLPEGS